VAWVYILRGANGRHYIGATDDLERRLSEHRRGGTHTTARLGATLDLVASRELASMAEARALEQTLKKKKNPRLVVFSLTQGNGLEMK
jgi:predicted GIY-YIG superfamily endonuclease